MTSVISSRYAYRSLYSPCTVLKARLYTTTVPSSQPSATALAPGRGAARQTHESRVAMEVRGTPSLVYRWAPLLVPAPTRNSPLPKNASDLFFCFYVVGVWG